MKNVFTAIALLVFTFFTGANAQTGKESQHHYVVLTKKVPQLHPILLAAENLKAEDGAAFGTFEVIICGQEIGEVTDAAQMDPFISRAEELGVKLIACGFSLNKFKVDRKAVPKEMEIVENGILYNFQLQKKGYKSLSL